LDCFKDSVGFTLAVKQVVVVVVEHKSKKLMAFETSQLFTPESAPHLVGLCAGLDFGFEVVFVVTAIVVLIPVLVGLLVYRHVLILRD